MFSLPFICLFFIYYIISEVDKKKYFICLLQHFEKFDFSIKLEDQIKDLCTKSYKSYLSYKITILRKLSLKINLV